MAPRCRWPNGCRAPRCSRLPSPRSSTSCSINIVGFAIGGLDLPYIKALRAADPQVWSYIDTLSLHDLILTY